MRTEHSQANCCNSLLPALRRQHWHIKWHCEKNTLGIQIQKIYNNNNTFLFVNKCLSDIYSQTLKKKKSNTISGHFNDSAIALFLTVKLSNN